MASSHCEAQFLHSTNHKMSTNTAKISSISFSNLLSDKNTLDSPVSLPSPLIKEEVKYSQNYDLDNLRALLKKMLEDPHSLKDIKKYIAKEQKKNSSAQKVRKISKKKGVARLWSKPKKRPKESTNLTKRPNKEMDLEEVNELSNPKKHVKGENGRIERLKSHKSKERSVESKENKEGKEFKSSASKQINYSRKARTKREESPSSQATQATKGQDMAQTMEEEPVKTNPVHDQLKPLISEILQDYIKKFKQIDLASDGSLSTCQSSPRSNAKKSKKNRGKSSVELDMKELIEKNLVASCEVSNQNDNILPNPETVEALLKYTTSNLAPLFLESAKKTLEQESLASEDSLRLASNIQSETTMLIEDSHQSEIPKKGQIDSFFDVNQNDTTPVIQKTPVGKTHQVDVPKFTLNTKSRYIKKRYPPKGVWNPELIDEELLLKHYKKIEEAVGQEIENEERALECLQKFQMNIDKLIENIKKNKFHYQTCLSLEQRVLRNRKNH